MTFLKLKFEEKYEDNLNINLICFQLLKNEVERRLKLKNILSKCLSKFTKFILSIYFCRYEEWYMHRYGICSVQNGSPLLSHHCGIELEAITCYADNLSSS